MTVKDPGQCCGFWLEEAHVSFYVLASEGLLDGKELSYPQFGKFSVTLHLNSVNCHDLPRLRARY